MKILAIINDSMNGFQQYQATGTMPATTRRVVEVNLNAEQVKLLKIKNGEVLESLSLID